MWGSGSTAAQEGGAVVSAPERGTIRAGPLLAGPVPTNRGRRAFSLRHSKMDMEDVHRSSPPASIQEATLAPERVLTYFGHSM
jgi:hypothetical protein